MRAFYRNILDHAREIIFYTNGELIVWNNRKNLIDGKSIFLKECYDKGVILVQEFCQETDSGCLSITLVYIWVTNQMF